MKKPVGVLFFLWLGLMGCYPEEEGPMLIDGIWKAEEETKFYFYEYTLELKQVEDSIAVIDKQILATYREPTKIAWTHINGNLSGNKANLKFRDGSGFVRFDGVILGHTMITSKYYGFLYGGEYQETLRGEVIFTKVD